VLAERGSQVLDGRFQLERLFCRNWLGAQFNCSVFETRGHEENESFSRTVVFYTAHTVWIVPGGTSHWECFAGESMTDKPSNIARITHGSA
jgi:hypothetical protein